MLKVLLSKSNNSVFKISSQSDNTVKYIQQILINSGLNEIAKNTNFSPSITFQNRDQSTEIKTQFYIGFQNKEQVIVPIFEFYKELIDFYEY